jgi:hypothetical protein
MQSESGSLRTKPRLFDQVREVMRFKHYSIRTEEAYLGWIRRFILFDSLASHSLSLLAFQSMS